MLKLISELRAKTLEMLKLDYRYIYLLKSKKVYKIGISNNVKRRLEEINRTLKRSGKPTAKVVAACKVLRAANKEKALHLKNIESRLFYYRGDGGSEWFALGFFQVLSVVLFLWWQWVKLWGSVTSFTAFILLFTYSIL